MVSQPPPYEDAPDIPVAASESKSESPGSQEKNPKDFMNEKDVFATEIDTTPPIYNAEGDDHFGETAVLTTAKDLVTHIIHVQDDPSLNPWTFRMFFIGMGKYPASLNKADNLYLQASAWQSLLLSFKRYTTSSRK